MVPRRAACRARSWARRSTRRSSRAFRTTSSRWRGSPKASFEITERFNATLGGALLRLRGRARSCTSAGLFADRIVDPDEPTRRSRLPGESTEDGLLPRVLLSYDVIRELPAERSGGRGIPARRHQRSAEQAAVLGGGPHHVRWPRQFRERDALELRARREDRLRRRPRPVQYRGVLRRHLRPADAGRCGHLLVAYRHQRARGRTRRASSSSSPPRRPTASTSASAATYTEAELDTSVTSTNGGVTTIVAGIEEGNRLPSVPEFQLSANATYSWPMGERVSTASSPASTSTSAAATRRSATRPDRTSERSQPDSGRFRRSDHHDASPSTRCCRPTTSATCGSACAATTGRPHSS